ncbi:RNA polymerase sigma-70 factor [Chitinophaga sp. MM2321]|uniref:RNA polymerase sigma factor n=1 Tax=Chitinophaga sp. MM2321 TaxID=3137178 RepID=UPI0032D597BC
MQSSDVLFEKELLLRVADGDEKAFRKIFDLYKEPFYAAALKMTRSDETAEEIVQEVFVTLWLRRANLAAVEHPSSYLFTIVYNCIRAHFKKLAIEKRLKQNIGEQHPVGECLTEERLIDKENQQLLQDIIHQLPPQQQLIYQLSRKQGLSRDEIADHLAISPHTVKNHLLKALKYIRSHYHHITSLLFSLFSWIIFRLL